MSDSLLLVALGWTWIVPGAYLWSAAVRTDTILPVLPTAVWSFPGEAWRRSPVVLVVGLLLLASLPLSPLGGKRPLGRARPYIVAAIVFVALVHLVWGVALVTSLGGT